MLQHRLQMGRQLLGQAQGSGQRTDSAALAALGHMDRLVIQDLGKFGAALGHQGGLDPQRAGRRIPFGGGPRLVRLPQLEPHPKGDQGAPKIDNPLPFVGKGGRIPHQLLDLAKGQLRITGPAPIDVTGAAAGQGLGPGPPLTVGDRQLLQQAVIPIAL